MAQYMMTLVKSEPNLHLTVEELNLLAVAYKNYAGDTRAVRRVYSSFLGKLSSIIYMADFSFLLLRLVNSID
jgi:hypothetical protein